MIKRVEGNQGKIWRWKVHCIVRKLTLLRSCIIWILYLWEDKFYLIYQVSITLKFMKNYSIYSDLIFALMICYLTICIEFYLFVLVSDQDFVHWMVTWEMVPTKRLFLSIRSHALRESEIHEYLTYWANEPFYVMSCLKVQIKPDLKITYFLKPTYKFQKVWIALIKIHLMCITYFTGKHASMLFTICIKR